MNRRTFLFGLALASVSGQFAAEAQQANVAKIGLLSPTTSVVAANQIEAFRRGLRELGHVDGKTFVLELLYSEGRTERLPELARELVRHKVDVIVTSTDVAVAAAKRETRTIPIVMTFSTDPVGTGLVTSLAHPGGNITGLSNISAGLAGKRVELLKEAIPGLSRVAYFWNPDVRGNLFDYKETESAARSLRLELQSIEFANALDLDDAFSTVTGRRAQALIVSAGNPVTFAQRTELVGLTLKKRLPSVYAIKEYVSLGGLMSYGPSLPAMYRRAATYVDKILKGAKPADLPVEQPTKFELVINLKTAKALGLTIPQSLLLRADQVIE